MSSLIFPILIQDDNQTRVEGKRNPFWLLGRTKHKPIRVIRTSRLHDQQLAHAVVGASSCSEKGLPEGSSRFNLENSVVPNGMKGHMEEIILHRLCMPEKMLLSLSHPKLHFKILRLRYG